MTNETNRQETFDAVLIGASGGIGRALAEHLLARRDIGRLVATARRPDVLDDYSWSNRETVRVQALDLEDETSIANCADSVRSAGIEPRLVIIASGLLHDSGGTLPEKSWASLSADGLARSFAVNSIGPALIAKHFLPIMPRQGRAVFAALSARVGSISDNRLGGWYSYRASKTALNMLIKTLAIEWRRRNREAICVGLHPGTVDTGLSAPFQAGVPAGKLFTPDHAASHLLTVLDGLGPDDSGKVHAWDGSTVPS